MTMTREQEVRSLLQSRARELRPVGERPAAQLVQIANQLGVEVKLVLCPINGKTPYQARCEIHAHSLQIVIYRHSATAAVAPINPSDEHLLSSRERFSVAHELGHCIAYQSCGLKPVQERDNRREYWYHERVMNEFASALLVPLWLSSRWRSQLANIDATCLFRVGDWAKECKTSPEVVVTALVRDMEGIGFLKVGEGLRVRTDKRVFVVFHSSSSNNLTLPNLYSHIDDTDFVNTIKGKGGVISLPRCRLGSIELNDLQVAWRTVSGKARSRRREFREAIRLSGSLYWVCAFIGGPAFDEDQGVLQL